MFLKEIRSLKEIDAEHLLQYKCQPYAEGVESAWNEYNMLVPLEDAEMKVKMKLALAYADMENMNDHAEGAFQKGKIDFFEYILDYE